MFDSDNGRTSERNTSRAGMEMTSRLREKVNGMHFWDGRKGKESLIGGGDRARFADV